MLKNMYFQWKQFDINTMPPQAANKNKQDAKKSAAELQAANDQLTEELEATKLELETVKQKLNIVVVKLLEAADHRYILFW